MQEVDDKKLSDLSKRFLQAISYCGLSGYKLKKDNIISSESTLTSIKKGIQLPSKKTIDAFCEKYDAVSYTHLIGTIRLNEAGRLELTTWL